MSWVLTRGLTNLRNQVNTRWPNRDKASDGTISDAAHQAESSTGHSPDDTAGSNPAWDGDSDSTPEVRAWDMDSDLRESGSTAQMVVDHIRKLPNVASVIRYIIYNHKMYHSRDNFAPTDYTGSSPHTEHIHFEGAWTDAADNNTTFNFRLEEVGDMALDSADAQKVWETDGCVTMPDWHPTKPTNPEISAGYAMYIALNEAHEANTGAAAVKTQVAALSSQVTALGNGLNAAIATGGLTLLAKAAKNGSKGDTDPCEVVPPRRGDQIASTSSR